MSVHAHDDSPFSGTRLHDTMASTFTLTSERKDPPYTVEVTPGQRDAQSETSMKFTATHKGETETQADLMIWGHGISTTTPGCETDEGRERDEATFVTCPIGKGEKKTVELTAAKVEADECPVTWELSWLNGRQTFGIEGNVACA
ncbi:hypothetical protein [Streptomyces formicae]